MKAARHAMIYKLIEQNEIETQEDLLGLLIENGFNVTQATVSRDIKELKLVKAMSKDGTNYRYSTVETDDTLRRELLLQLLRSSVISTDVAGNTVVLKTIYGAAGVVAEGLDSLRWEDIVGTVAGINTIFVAVRTPNVAHELVEKIRKLI
ncbi:MAG: arginine repressor [Clostridia bacterium]